MYVLAGDSAWSRSGHSASDGAAWVSVFPNLAHPAPAQACCPECSGDGEVSGRGAEPEDVMLNRLLPVILRPQAKDLGPASLPQRRFSPAGHPSTAIPQSYTTTERCSCATLASSP